MPPALPRRSPSAALKAPPQSAMAGGGVLRLNPLCEQRHGDLLNCPKTRTMRCKACKQVFALSNCEAAAGPRLLRSKSELRRSPSAVGWTTSCCHQLRCTAPQIVKQILMRNYSFSKTTKVSISCLEVLTHSGHLEVKQVALVQLDLFL